MMYTHIQRNKHEGTEKHIHICSRHSQREMLQASIGLPSRISKADSPTNGEKGKTTVCIVRKNIPVCQTKPPSEFS